MATPLESGVPGSADLHGATPYGFMTGSITDKHFPNEARGRLDGVSFATFEARAKDAVAKLGYSISAYDPIELPVTVKSTKHTLTLWGTLVAERDVRLDLALRRTAGRRALVFFLAGIGALALAIPAIQAMARSYALLGLTAAALLIVAGLVSFSGRGAFDSDVIYLVFETKPIVPEGTTLTRETPFTFDFWSGSARISSKNWQAKHSNGRDFHATLAGAMAPSATPRDLFQLIRG
jgi:hypothetical protein